MKRQGFILGLLSIGGQVLLLRELVASLNGDELFIGTALFGWLVSVAAGAYIGGRRRALINPLWLFVAGALLIPVMIVAVRLSPLAVTDVTGELIPFTTSVAISALSMFPIGLISGWLFPAISTRVISPAPDAIVTVYLFEGIGAFVGGMSITLFAGGLLSALTMGTILGAIVIGATLLESDIWHFVIVTAAVALVSAAAIVIVPRLDKSIDARKYASYEVLASFDTHYGHQALLARDNSLVLMTDNEVEAVHPDVESAENQLLAPLLYHPEAKRVLYVGRAEFGVAQLAEELTGIILTVLDSRESLTDILRDVPGLESDFAAIHDDPVAYLSASSVVTGYDIIIINPGEPDSYQTARLFSASFLSRIGSRLAADGILSVPTGYDTDRYIAPEKKQVLSVIHHALESSFPRVTVWPGTMTVFMASVGRSLDLPVDSLRARLNTFGYEPQFLTGYHLADRLAMMKTNRLRAALSDVAGSHQTVRPILPHYQALYRSLVDSIDRKLIHAIIYHPLWLIVLPLAIFGFFAPVFRGHKRYSRFGLFLYFTAGIVSLALELVSFYVYQTMAGSLYAEMAALIGAFMLGLAAGTYYSQRIGVGALEFPALIVLLVAVLVFLTMYADIGPESQLVFHACFLFVTAVATATLFVGATNRFYIEKPGANRGLGYAWELVGSSIGALFTMTVLLPIIGLTWLLISLAVMIALAMIGAMATAKPTLRIGG